MHREYQIHIHIFKEIFHAQIIGIPQTRIHNHKCQINVTVLDAVQLTLVGIPVSLGVKFAFHTGIPPVQIACVINTKPFCLHQICHACIRRAQRLYHKIADLILLDNRYKMDLLFDLRVKAIS